MREVPWASEPVDLLAELDSSRNDGLSDDDARRRLEEVGPNALRRHERRSGVEIFVDQFRSLIILLLVVAAIAAFFFGEYVEGFAVTIVIMVNAAIGFVTELRAVQSMEALRELGHVSTRVIRGGREQTIDAESLVPGDVVVVEEGDVITADLRILDGSRLQADESTLTGESTPVSKSVEAVAADTELAERKCMLFKGTAVTRGTGRALVVGTGMETELGQISELVEAAEESRTPLEERLDRLGRVLIFVTLGVAALATAAGIARGRDVVLMIEMGIALAVASVPEGLPVVATIALASGMRKMAARNALINRLSSVETLGATTVIFTDKTGTLTENRMTVTRIELASGRVDVTGEGLSVEGRFERDGSVVDPEQNEALARLLRVGVLCNNAALDDGAGNNRSGNGAERDRSGGGTESPGVTGDPTEVALLVAGAKAGIERRALLDRLPERREESFDPDLRMMATVHETNDGDFIIAVKGAPDAVLDACDRALTDGGVEELAPDVRSGWLERNEQMASDGLRVLAFATRRAGSADENAYEGLIFLGCAGLQDPARRDVRESVKACHGAGVNVVMVTGDQIRTAEAIAEAVGITTADDPGGLTGRDLVDIDEDDERIPGTKIFARVSPAQKLELIRRFQESGEIVAMTGDGVNDAPALKSADIGVAMGQRGTQVARQASDMILRDDAFSTIVAAIERGRIIFENIRRFVVFLLSCNVSEVLVVGLASIAGSPLPILPLHLLYLNFVTDVFPALALGVGKGDPGIMSRSPRPPDEAVMERRQWFDVAVFGSLITITTLGAFAVARLVLDLPERESVTIAFLTIGFAQLFNVFNMRSPESGVLSNDVLTNKYVLGSVVLCTALLLVAVYVPGLADVLSVSAPRLTGWMLVAGASIVPLVVGQILLAMQGRTATPPSE